MRLELLWLPLLAVAWLFGLSASPAGRAPALLAFAGGLGALLALRHARARLWGFALAPLAWLGGLSAAPTIDTNVAEERGLARVEATVVDVRHGADATVDLVLLRGRFVEREDDAALPEWRVRVRGVVDPPPRGARVRGLVQVRPLARYWNPSPHPSWPDAHAPHAEGRLVGALEVIDEGGLAWLERARGSLRTRLERTLPPHAAAVARALLLGDGPAVEGPERDALRGSGLAHLLAVSGLHVALLAAFVYLAFERLLRGRVLDPPRAAALATIPVVLGFALVAGGAPSVWRAASMAVIVAGLRALRRRPRPLAVASLAIVLFAVASPDDALRPAFLLSAAATLAIVTGTRIEGASATTAAADAPADARILRESFAMSARTTLATAPLVIWCFGELPVFGVVANVLLLPIGTLLLVPLAFAHALLASIGLESITAPLFVASLDALVGAAELFARVTPGTALPPPSTIQGWILVASAMGLLALRRPRHLALVGLLTAGALGLAEVHLRALAKPEGLLRLTQLDVGQGDGAILDLPDGSAMLIDGGGGRPDPGERALVPLLRARRRDVLAVVVISHPHPDHFAGLHALLPELDAGRLRIGEVWDGGQAEAEEPHGPAAALLRAFRRRGVRVRTPCGEHTIGGARVEVRWPCPRFDAGYDANDNSLVLRVTHGRRAILFTGDVERHAEEALVASDVDLRADVLKVPHHGSRTSSSEAFLARVRPTLAVASQGRGNGYGHPHPDVVARYDALGIPLLRTRESGGVVIETDGESIVSWSWRDEVPTFHDRAASQ
ncbi:MAG: DNA internalization-related competence protein ComEC/Rec2 [Myxococcota bacterium]|jgi:competence protein ComEC|nr:DNA internalization-related competence protein ComEC/Rec2 [Myxococcota bacterium]